MEVLNFLRNSWRKRWSDSQEDWDRFCEGLEGRRAAIPDRLSYRLITSIPRRLGVVRRAKVYLTKYQVECDKFVTLLVCFGILYGVL
jgi:hypothetical protein